MNCNKCNVNLVAKNWPNWLIKKHHYICKFCYSKNKNVKRKYLRSYKKVNALQMVGSGACACCKESNVQFLNIDHINNNGNEERELLGLVGQNMYAAVSDGMREIDDLRVLCYNCNCARGNYKFCSHEFSQSTGFCALCNDPLVTQSVCNKPQNYHEFFRKSNINICLFCIINKKSREPSRSNRKDFRKILNLRSKIINEYGGKCECCGESNYIFLTIDHILFYDNLRSHSLYRYLLKNNCPKDNYRLLCYNCNCGRGHNGSDGICPHKKETIPNLQIA